MRYVLILLLILNTHLISIDNQWMVYDRSNSEIPCIIINSIEIDGLNNLWLGTVQEFTKPSAFGLVKYDGTSWELFKNGTSAKKINSLVIKNDTIWIAAEDGLFLFHNNQILSFSEINKNFPNTRFLKTLLDSNGNIWASSILGLFKIFNNNYELFDTSNSPIPENYIRALTVDNKNHLYVGFPGKIFKYSNNLWDSLRFLNRFLRGQTTSEFELDCDIYRNLWIDYSIADSIIRMDSNENIMIFDYYKRGINKWKNFSNDIYPDNNGELWFCTEGLGIFHYNGKIWEVFDNINSPLPSLSINTAKMDRYGNLWIGTDKGLAVYNPNGIVGVEDKVTEEEKIFSCYPNPSSGFITLRYRIERYSEVERYISDILGNRKELRKENKFPGDYIEDYNLSNLPSGIYFATVKSGTEIITKQFVIMR